MHEHLAALCAFCLAAECFHVSPDLEVEHPADLICDVITEIMADKNPSEDEVCRRYYTFWSVVHGLVSINIVRKGVSDEINLQILKDAIGGIIRAIAE